MRQGHRDAVKLCAGEYRQQVIPHPGDHQHHKTHQIQVDVDRPQGSVMWEEEPPGEDHAQDQA